MKGRITNFDLSTGYGFIKSEECPKDVFCHINDFLCDKNDDNIHVGRDVEFKAYRKIKGFVAKGITIIEEEKEVE